MPPLDGLKVIDLTRVLAGPFCTTMLGDMGAEVVKVEEPLHGDESRTWPPFVDGWSSYFLSINRNKKSIALDLKTPIGREVLERLIRNADVLVENFKPGSLERLGFPYSRVHVINPAIIHCSITGYGHNGPGENLSGYDPIFQAESGLMTLTGFPGGPPTRVGMAISDFFAAMYACQGILLALIERQRTRKGQHVDIALFDSMISMLGMQFGIYQATGAPPERRGNEHPSLTPYETFEAKDGTVMICCGNERLWRGLCTGLKAPDLMTDARFRTNIDRLAHRHELKAALESIFAELTVADLAATLEEHGVPCGRVRTLGEALEHPQLKIRGMLHEFSLSSGTAFKVLANPIKMSEQEATSPSAPPRLGQHTEEVLREIGYDDAEVRRLVESLAHETAVRV